MFGKRLWYLFLPIIVVQVFLAYFNDEGGQLNVRRPPPERPRRSRGGRRTSQLGRGEAEAIEAGKPRSAVSYEFAEKSSGESRRPRRERPRVTARQRRIRARRRRERDEERAEGRRSRESSRGDSTRGPLREAFAATTPMQSQSDRVPDSIRRRPRSRAAELRGMTVTPRRRAPSGEHYSRSEAYQQSLRQRAARSRRAPTEAAEERTAPATRRRRRPSRPSRPRERGQRSFMRLTRMYPSY